MQQGASAKGRHRDMNDMPSLRAGMIDHGAPNRLVTVFICSKGDRFRRPEKPC